MEPAPSREWDKEHARLLQIVHDTRVRYEADHNDENRKAFMQAMKQFSDLVLRSKPPNE